MSESSDEWVEINVRQTSGGTFPVKVKELMLVSEFKTKLMNECEQTRGVEVERQRLIYQGHVLKNEKTLGSYGIKANHTIHFVKGIASTQQRNSNQTNQAATNNNNNNNNNNNTNNSNVNSNNPLGAFGGGMGGMGGMGGVGGMGGLTAGMDHQTMQRMESLAMQSMLSNPELVRTLIENNPTLRNLMESNPELRHVMNDPETLRQAMEVARNPDLMREQMRMMDRSMQQLEMLPEGKRREDEKNQFLFFLPLFFSFSLTFSYTISY